MMLKRFYIIALASLLLFQSGLALSATPMDLDQGSVQKMAMHNSDHDCCKGEDQSLACELHCFSGLSTALLSAPTVFFIPHIGSAIALTPPPLRLPRFKQVYRPPIA